MDNSLSEFTSIFTPQALPEEIRAKYSDKKYINLLAFSLTDNGIMHVYGTKSLRERIHKDVTEHIKQAIATRLGINVNEVKTNFRG